MPPEGQPPASTDVAIIPASGEVVDLNDAVQVARAYRSVIDLEGELRRAKATLRDALVAQSNVLGRRTMHLEGLGKVEVTGGTETIYDAQALKRDLLDAGMPPERVAEIVVETIDYKVKAVEAKKAASANPDYAAIIEKHKRVYDKTPSVSVP
jgi:hypothetical protein